MCCWPCWCIIMCIQAAYCADADPCTSDAAPGTLAAAPGCPAPSMAAAAFQSTLSYTNASSGGPYQHHLHFPKARGKSNYPKSLMSQIAALLEFNFLCVLTISVSNMDNQLVRPRFFSVPKNDFFLFSVPKTNSHGTNIYYHGTNKHFKVSQL
jgi:hypothetical protein